MIEFLAILATFATPFIMIGMMLLWIGAIGLSIKFIRWVKWKWAFEKIKWRITSRLRRKRKNG